MQKLFHFLLGLIGAAAGVGIAALMVRFQLLQGVVSPQLMIAAYIGFGIIGFFIFWMLSPRIIQRIHRLFLKMYDSVAAAPLMDIIFGTVGLIIGLTIAQLISRPILQLSIVYVGNIIGVVISIFIYIILGILGLRIAIKSKDEIIGSFQKLREESDLKRTDPEKEKKRTMGLTRKLKNKGKEIGSVPKILDTSVIIDGRIFEVMKLGFLEGPFIVSQYVLEELQHISDSADNLRRERGRRGLDGINEMQKQKKYEIVIDNRIIEDVKEVDAKLLVLTNQYEGKIVTNDYNLNKVATVQNIPVLNVNDLANALKPIVIPGEVMTVRIIKEGKELEQGLGYLEDGTMIVVENGRDHIGKTVETIVTSVLQTSAGKMIFTRIPDERL